jgi:hypothetical protein
VQSQELESLFGFLGKIQTEPALRSILNTVETVPDVVAIAADQGLNFQASTLLRLFELCNEAAMTRYGLMDEKLIRIYLQRNKILTTLDNT